MKTIKNRALLFLLFAATAWGCSVLSPQPDRSRFFVLVPSAGSGSIRSAAVMGSGRDLIVGLGPITIPPYLKRPEIVTRLNGTELAVSDTDRWAEPLDTSVPSVLARDLSIDLPGLQIVTFPWPRRHQVDYRVSVQFLHLEGTANGKAQVEAVWKIRRGTDDVIVQSGDTSSSRAAGKDQSSASAALSQGIAQVGQDIARALERQSKLEADTSRPPRS